MENFKNILLAGTGTSINDINLRTILNIIPSMGINNIVLKYPEVKHWIFSDQKFLDIAKQYYGGQKVICSKHLENKLRVFNGINPLYSFNSEDEIITEFNKEKKLTNRKFTVVSAISYLYCLGVKNIYLAGIEHNYKNWTYFYGGQNTGLDKKTVDYAVEAMLEYKELFKKRGGDIYTLYEDDWMGFTKINQNELIREVFKVESN